MRGWRTWSRPASARSRSSPTPGTSSAELSSNGRTGWAHAAAEYERRTTRGNPLANRDLWKRLLELEGSLAVTRRHVRGHRPKKDTSDDARYNREVDALAWEARRGFVVPAPQTGA
jgi:ribonuclease HI